MTSPAREGQLTVRTFGHGTLLAEDFISLLDGAHIERVVDVRSFPGSRKNPQFGRQAMEQWVAADGFGYVWMPELGGRRRPVEGSRHTALRHVSFRAYGDYMETSTFQAGIDDLLELAEKQSTTVMCSESLWWRCHRRLIADYLELVRHVHVEHLMHDGRLTAHHITEGVRLHGGALLYDVGVTVPLNVD